MSNDHRSPTRRRFIQFSIRSMLLLIVLAAILLARLQHQAAVQRRAVDALLKCDVAVHYEWEVDHEGFPMDSPASIGSMASWFGVEYFHAPVVATVENANQANKALPHLQRLVHLKKIWVFASVEPDDEFMRAIPEGIEVIVVMPQYQLEEDSIPDPASVPKLFGTGAGTT